MLGYIKWTELNYVWIFIYVSLPLLPASCSVALVWTLPPASRAGPLPLWSCLLPWPCWCPSSLPPSVYMDCGYLDRGPCLLLISHNFCHIHFCNAVHMTYFASVHLRGGILLCCFPECFIPLVLEGNLPQHKHNFELNMCACACESVCTCAGGMMYCLMCSPVMCSGSKLSSAMMTPMSL